MELVVGIGRKLRTGQGTPMKDSVLQRILFIHYMVFLLRWGVRDKLMFIAFGIL